MELTQGECPDRESPEESNGCFKSHDVMLNPAILYNMFEVCDAEDLPTFRQVCRLWWTTSMDAWRTRVKFVVQEEDLALRGRGLGVRTLRGERGITITNLLPLINGEDPNGEEQYRLVTKPIRNFQLRQWDFSKSIPLKADFWTRCTTWITRLALDECTFDNFSTLKEVITEKAPNLQKLALVRNSYRFKSQLQSAIVPHEKLKYLKVKLGEDRDTQRLPILWADLFKLYPKLTTLKLDNFIGFDKNLKELFLTILRLRKRDKTKLLLRHLDIMYMTQQATAEFPLPTLQLLRAMQLPLEVFKVDIGFDTVGSRLKQLLQIHASTMKELRCFKGPYSLPSQNSPFGVTFDSLKILHFYGPVVANFKFLQHTPNLECLHIFQKFMTFKKEGSLFFSNNRSAVTGKTPVSLSYNMEVPEYDDTCLKLERLMELKGNFWIHNPDSFTHLTKWMPNIRKLEIILNSRTFPIICAAYSETLNELNLSEYCSITDEALTGIPLETSAGQSVSLESRPSNLSDLNVLHTLWNMKASGSSHSIDHGYLQLGSLARLQLYVTKELPEADLRKLMTLSDLIDQVEIGGKDFSSDYSSSSDSEKAERDTDDSDVDE